MDMCKTAKTDDLIQAVRDVYEGKSALDASITRKLMSNLFKKQENRVVEPLTDRELDVLRLAARGYTNKAIGMHLNISDRTVQGHLAHIFSKMQATSRTEAVMRAVSLGWISQGPDQLTEE
jgi:DNA-binding NarL/FixJ family response regulator